MKLKSCLVVIETKNMSGNIFGSPKSTTWTQYLGKNKSSFQNPIRQNFKHRKAIEAILGSSVPLKELVCFVGSAKFPKGVPDGVVQLDGILDALDDGATEVGPEALQKLHAADVSSKEVGKEHIENLKRKHGPDHRPLVGQIAIGMGVVVAIVAFVI